MISSEINLEKVELMGIVMESISGMFMICILYICFAHHRLFELQLRMFQNQWQCCVFLLLASNFIVLADLEILGWRMSGCGL